MPSPPRLRETISSPFLGAQRNDTSLTWLELANRAHGMSEGLTKASHLNTFEQQNQKLRSSKTHQLIHVQFSYYLVSHLFLLISQIQNCRMIKIRVKLQGTVTGQEQTKSHPWLYSKERNCTPAGHSSPSIGQELTLSNQGPSETWT